MHLHCFFDRFMTFNDSPCCCYINICFHPKNRTQISQICLHKGLSLKLWPWATYYRLFIYFPLYVFFGGVGSYARKGYVRDSMRRNWGVRGWYLGVTVTQDEVQREAEEMRMWKKARIRRMKGITFHKRINRSETDGWFMLRSCFNGIQRHFMYFLEGIF